MLGDHWLAQIGPFHGGSVSQWLPLAPFAIRTRGEASEKDLVSSHAEKVLSKASQESNSKHKERLNVFYTLPLGQ